MSSRFGTWLYLNWPQLYVKAGATVWLAKAGIDTKKEFDDMAKYSNKLVNELVIGVTAGNLAYYSPNVLFWPVNFAIDTYAWSVKKYYDK